MITVARQRTWMIEARRGRWQTSNRATGADGVVTQGLAVTSLAEASS
jgi:hypothetical protein